MWTLIVVGVVWVAVSCALAPLAGRFIKHGDD
jgi:hypothetical protein